MEVMLDSYKNNIILVMILGDSGEVMLAGY